MVLKAQKERLRGTDKRLSSVGTFLVCLVGEAGRSWQQKNLEMETRVI